MNHKCKIPQKGWFVTKIYQIVFRTYFITNCLYLLPLFLREREFFFWPLTTSRRSRPRRGRGPWAETTRISPDWDIPDKLAEEKLFFNSYLLKKTILQYKIYSSASLIFKMMYRNSCLIFNELFKKCNSIGFKSDTSTKELLSIT